MKNLSSWGIQNHEKRFLSEFYFFNKDFFTPNSVFVKLKQDLKKLENSN